MPKKKVVKKKPKGLLKIEIDQLLYNSRQVFLNGVIDEKLTENIIRELRGLSEVSNKPIVMYINSRGGFCQEGLAIIDTMRTIRSHVVTVISGIAASMAGVISITGAERLMTKNSVWMAHDLSNGIFDYAEKIYDKVDYMKQLEKQIFTIFRDRTKLSERELTKSRHGELYLFAEEAKKKRIVDLII